MHKLPFMRCAAYDELGSKLSFSAFCTNVYFGLWSAVLCGMLERPLVDLPPFAAGE
jgi:hypothetical protein